MNELRPCDACRRHVAISESDCPFCGASNATARNVLGRVSRAAVLATALAGTACGGKQAPKPVENQQAETADAGVVTPVPDRDPDREEDQQRHRNGVGNPKMPYGAPPASRRLV